MRRLILTVGLPRAGKSTWARAQGHPIVSPDAIRLALHGHRFLDAAEGFVWATAYVMARALFLAGHRTVVVDATNVSAKRRDAWAKLEDVELHVVDTPPAVCIERARLEGDFELIPVIERMAAEWDLPCSWKGSL